MASRDPVHPGDVIAGRYRIERVIGRGATGVVLAAMDLRTDTLRAIKLMSVAALSRSGSEERFLREVKATAALRSEHVARVYDVGRVDGGAPYMVMEHLAGTDLRDELKRRYAIPPHEAVRYVLEACEALTEAHAAGIVHRDLKPANLFLARGSDGVACLKVLDFGLSKVLSAPGDDPELTKTNAVLGSPYYMSPEQVLSARDVDARTDVWSLGVILYQLVTGQLPFRSGNAGEVVAMVLRETPAPPSKVRAGLPLGIDRVVARCLEKRVEDRFASVSDLALALEPFVVRGGVPASARPPPMTDGDDAATRALPVKTLMLADVPALRDVAEPPHVSASPLEIDEPVEIPGARRPGLSNPLVVSAFVGVLVVVLAIGILVIRSGRAAKSAEADATAATATAPLAATASAPQPAETQATESAPTAPTATAPAASATAQERRTRPGKAPLKPPPAQRRVSRGSDVVDPFAR